MNTAVMARGFYRWIPSPHTKKRRRIKRLDIIKKMISLSLVTE
jgi:hypothetical protein